MADMSQVNIKEMIKEYDKEEAVRRMETIMMILKLQKQVLELQVTEKKKKRRQEDREQRRIEYEERREEEE